MTVQGAIEAVRRVGRIECNEGKLRLRFPKSETSALQSAIEVLRTGRTEALALLSEFSPCSTGDLLCDETGIPWAEWKAGELNQIFRENSPTGIPGRITAATVRHGERKAGAAHE